MKNATRYRQHTYYRMCSTDVYCSKQTGSSSTKGNHHPSFLRFRIGQKKTVDKPKFVAAPENIVKKRNPANIRKWIYDFITLNIILPLEARVYCSQ